MTDDLVKRLRVEGENAMRRQLSLGMHKLCSEAADEIERLHAELKRVKGKVGEVFEVTDELYQSMDEV